MIKTYLNERRSWIFFFLFLQLLTLFFAYIDPTIPFDSVLYLVFLSFIIFILFLIIRYHKETAFYRSLAEWDPHLDLESISHSKSPFEKLMEKSLILQTERLKQEADIHRTTLEKEKDELLAWIHEIKTPLTAMHLMLERLEDETMKAQLTYEWLRIHFLLDQQLHQKRIPFMENDLYMEEINLKTIVFNEIKPLRSWCMQKGIGFDVDLQEMTVLTDAKWLSFIIRQLLTNAIKYSQESDILIRSYRKKDQTLLEIRDFGRGIAPQDLPRIFDKGFTSTANHHGHAATGMGLYLAQKAAQPLHIQIHVHSELGGGTIVTLAFPQRNEFVRITGM